MAYFNFGEKAISVFISQDSPTRYERNRHYDSYAPVKQQWLKERIESRGFTVDQLRTQMRARAAFSMLELIDWNYNKTIRVHNAPDLFGV